MVLANRCTASILIHKIIRIKIIGQFFDDNLMMTEIVSSLCSLLATNANIRFNKVNISNARQTPHIR